MDAYTESDVAFMRQALEQARLAASEGEVATPPTTPSSSPFGTLPRGCALGD